MNWVLLPPWSTRAIAAIALGLLALAVLRWWRERRGGAALALRALIVGALLLVMLNPQLLLPRPLAEKPKLVVLLDSSASMATRDVSGESRFTAATRVLGNASTLAKLNQEFVLDFRQFDRTVRPADLSQLMSNTPDGDASEIGKSLMSAISELGDTKAQAGVLLVSDGRATAPDTLDAAQLALARSVPLWTWTVGGPVPRHDLWIETPSTEALAFSGEEVDLTATLHEDGYPNRSFKVDLLTDGNVVATKEFLPDTNGVARISMRVKAPAAGEQRYVFRVPSEPDEVDTANNERAVFLRSVGQKVRVLVAEGQPYWDTKFLVQSLKGNTNVELTVVYRLNSARYVAVVSATGSETRTEQDLFPRTADAMNAFDVIVLGREAEAFFDNNTEALLTDFVAKRGGSLIFARGKPYGGWFQSLAKFEPLAWGDGVVSGVKLRPTEAGRDNPIFDLGTAGSLEDLLERLPALDQASVTLGEKPLAVVLANTVQEDGPVLIAYQRYGQGRTISLNASGLWHWAFRESGQDESEIAYQRFWVSLLQWLLGGSEFLPGSDVALMSAHRYYNSEQPMQFLISTRNLDRAIYQPRLIISGNGKVTEVEPRARGESFVAEAGPFAPGTYVVTLKNNVGNPAELSQSIEVVSASVEKRELSADPDTMRQLAEISGGAVIGADDVARMPEIVRRWEAARELSYQRQSVWDRWWLMTGIFGLLGAEWWLRRREGLL
ncbi:MAG: hypothetical protein WBW41_06945 [Verrucomicrobiia bacterium]